MDNSLIRFFAEYMYSTIIIGITIVLFVYLYYLYSRKDRGEMIENRKNIIFTDQPLEEKEHKEL